MRTTLPIIAALLLATLAAAGDSRPVVTWVSDPVRADETVLALGGGFGTFPTIEVGRLRDDIENAGNADLWNLVENPVTVKPLQVSDHSIKFALPTGLKASQYAFRVHAGGLLSAVTVLNAPDVWWLQGDEGPQATPGGWLRLFGKCLATGGKTEVRLLPAGGHSLVLATTGDDYGVRAELPGDLSPGEYRVEVHNGCRGDLGWQPAGRLTVIPPVQWKQDVFTLTDFQGTPTEAMRAALDKAEANGGGIISLPRGRWEMKEPLRIPPGTVVKGVSRELTGIFWGDLKDPPPALIQGADFGLQDLTVYAQSYRCLISDQRESGRLRLSNLRVRATTFFMLGDPGGTFRGRTAPKGLGETTLLRLTAPNFQITNCDLYGNGTVIGIDPHGFVGQRGPWFGVISGNRISYGGQGYMIEAADGLIFENNEIFGNSPGAGGNGINTFWNNFSRNIYYGHNRIHDIYGWDREMMTLDAGGGAYFGKVAKVAGTKLTLAEDPKFMDYHPTRHHTDYRGAVVMILDGTGAGQYRVVTRNEGREWEVDRPWALPPDETSLLSIAPHRGRHIFQDNDHTDGGAFQLYGAALDTLVVGNRGRRMDGFFAWGLNPHGWGWQPAWRCQFLDNEIIEGNGFGHRAAFMGAVTGNNNESYTGPLARATILRRNKLHSNAYYRLNGTVDDAIIEGCSVRDADEGVQVRRPARNVLLRNNTIVNVKTPLTGDGISEACIITQER